MVDGRHIVSVLVGILCVIHETSAVSISASLLSGVCLCVNEPNVKAIRDPTNPSSVLVTLSNGDCFISNGGIYHNNGNTWYQLRDTQNGQIAWVDSYYLNIYLMTTCNSSALVTKTSHHTPTGTADECSVYGTTYKHGQHFRLHGLYCTCDDGYSACSSSGQNCFSGGIVYREGAVFDMPGSGTGCSCTKGTINCQSVIG